MINLFVIIFVMIMQGGSNYLSAMPGGFWCKSGSDSDASSAELTPASSTQTSPFKSGFSSGDVSPMTNLSPFTSPTKHFAQAFTYTTTRSPQDDTGGFLFGTPSPSPESSPSRPVFYDLPRRDFLEAAAEEDRYFSDEVDRRGIGIRLGTGDVLSQLKLNFMHFIYPEIRMQGDLPVLNGFHLNTHLSLCYKSGYVLNNQQRINRHGVYSAEVLVRGHSVGMKTFFPSHWENRNLTDALLDALQHISAVDQSSDTHIKLVGITSEELKIHFIINFKGQIITAYPDATVELQEQESKPLARSLF